MLRFVTFASAVVIVCLAVNVQAAPLSVRIDDHDFAFDVPLDAVYDYAGAGQDHLSVHQDQGHYVASYAYTGFLPTVPPSALGPPPPPSQFPYPVYSGTPIQFAGNLELDMYFDINDAPYTNPAGDVFDISLEGTRRHGRLTITGWIADQNWPANPLYPAPGPGPDIVLLDIEFTKMTLLARAFNDTADLVEGEGVIKTLLGVDMVEFPELTEGTCFFKFIAPLGTNLFPIAGAVYDPLVDFGLDPVYESRISGEAGVLVPEPASLALLCLGGISLLLRRRR